MLIAFRLRTRDRVRCNQQSEFAATATSEASQTRVVRDYNRQRSRCTDSYRSHSAQITPTSVRETTMHVCGRRPVEVFAMAVVLRPASAFVAPVGAAARQTAAGEPLQVVPFEVQPTFTCVGLPSALLPPHPHCSFHLLSVPP